MTSIAGGHIRDAQVHERCVVKPERCADEIVDGEGRLDVATQSRAVPLRWGCAEIAHRVHDEEATIGPAGLKQGDGPVAAGWSVLSAWSSARCRTGLEARSNPTNGPWTEPSAWKAYCTGKYSARLAAGMN